MKVEIKILDDGIPMPEYAKRGDAGFDLRATETVAINPGETVMLGTGIAIKIPNGYNGEVRPRSGIASKKSLAPINAPGTIDSGYTGEIMVPLHNYQPSVYWRNGEMRANIGGVRRVERGERIAQLVITPCIKARFEAVDVLEATERGATGFGSSGAM